MENKKRIFKTLKEITEINGISGREYLVKKYIMDNLKNVSGLKFETDNLGSLAVIKKGKSGSPIISFTAHMDEVGFMVTGIEKTGFIKFTPIGGWWGHVVLGQLLEINTRDGEKIKGVVGSIPPHMFRGDLAAKAKQVFKIDEMFLDIGAKSDKDVKDWGINYGDMITPSSSTWMSKNNDYAIGKAMDDRAGIVSGIEIIKNLDKIDHDCTVIFVASTQEEVGLRGARTATYKWTPDIGFAIDVTISNDVPGVQSKDTKLGSGVALSLMDGSIIGNENLIKEVEAIAKSNKIPYVFDTLTLGGTDAGIIHLTKDGVVSMTISIPSRYIHSHNSIVSLSDISNVVDLLVNFVKNSDNKLINKIKNG